MNPNEQFVITIAREVGSGGRTIGRKLAERLGIRYCDKALIRSLVGKFGLSVAEIERIKAQKRNWLSDFIEKIAPVPKATEFIGFEPKFGEDWNHDVTTEAVFKAESEVLKELADESSCVIAGRSGFFVLADHPNHVHIFIQAPRAQRVVRVMRRQAKTLSEAEAIVSGVDDARETYVKRFSGRSRYDVRNYDLVLNVAGMTEDEAVECILQYIRANG